MNKNVERINVQIRNTLERMTNLGYALYYNLPKIDQKKDSDRITWNNHNGERKVSSKHFLNVDQYLKIVSDNAYWVLLNDYSIIRCAFVFKDNKLESENLLWWPCPVKIDSNMVDEFGLVETVECLLQADSSESILMRSPIRIDFDIQNDKETHPMAHMHLQNENCRINTNYPICFNRFVNYIVKCFYPNWKLDFKSNDYIVFKYDKESRCINYYNKTEMKFE